MRISESELAKMKPSDYRGLCRRGEWTGSTLNACLGYGMTPMTIVPQEYAFDFFLFCHRNPHSFYLLDVTDPGSPHPVRVTPNADLRTDLPKYQVYVNGELVAEPTDIISYWRDDLVAFLTPCSRNFDGMLWNANVNFRLLSAYRTNIRLTPAGPFNGYMYCTCRLMKTWHDAIRAIQLSSRCLAGHGPPIHIGNPSVLGIEDLQAGIAPELTGPIAPQEPGEVPLFWACGQALPFVAIEAKIPLMILYGSPVCLLSLDETCEELAVF